MVLRCVFDRSGLEDWWAFKKGRLIDGIPKKGVDKLLHAVGSDLPLLRAQLVVALVDNDKLRPHLKLPKSACRRTVLEAIHQRAPSSDLVRLRVVLLEQNTETLLTSLRDRRLVPNRERDFEDALRKKSGSVLPRDNIFNAVAASDELRGARDALCAEVPSFGRLVRLLSDALSPTAAAP